MQRGTNISEARSVIAAVTLAAFSVTFAVPQSARAQQPPVPQCTTTTTTTTTCTGDAATLAVPGAAQAPAYPQPPAYPQSPPPPAYPYGQPYYYPPAGYPPPMYTPPALQFTPPKMHAEMRPRYGLLVSGLSLFLATYLGAASAAILEGQGNLAIPVAGPIVYIVKQNQQADQCAASFSYYGCDSSHVDGFLGTGLVINSLAQAAGVIMFLTGAATKTKVMVRDRVQVSILPTASPAMSGVTAVGTF